MVLQILQDVRNDFLGRREISCLFKALAGSLTRGEAVKMVAEKLKVRQDDVIPISLLTMTGTKDVVGLFYAYDDKENAKKHLSPHLWARMLQKEKRKAAEKK